MQYAAPLSAIAIAFLWYSLYKPYPHFSIVLMIGVFIGTLILMKNLLWEKNNPKPYIGDFNNEDDGV